MTTFTDTERVDIMSTEKGESLVFGKKNKMRIWKT